MPFALLALATMVWIFLGSLNMLSAILRHDRASPVDRLLGLTLTNEWKQAPQEKDDRVAK
jgi:hypothetical protein